MTNILLAASKKSVSGRWLQATPPAESDWIDSVTNTQNMERMTFWLRLQTDKYLKYWEKWIVYMPTRDAHSAITVPVMYV